MASPLAIRKTVVIPNTLTRRVLSHREHIGDYDVCVLYGDAGYAGVAINMSLPAGTPKRIRATDAYANYDDAMEAVIALIS